MEKLEALENSTVIELAKEIKEILMVNTKATCVRDKKRMKEEPQTNLGFDTECKMKKGNVNHIRKNKESPEN